MAINWNQLENEGKEQGFITIFGMHLENPFLYDVLEKLNDSGAKTFVVGGAVRDYCLTGTIKGIKDIDFEVFGMQYDSLVSILEKFGKCDLVGKSFGVIKFTHLETGDTFDFSIPRTDSKSGAGHQDFIVSFNPDLTPKEAAARRDFTFNAMMFDPLNFLLWDYYNGRGDLQRRVIRHTTEAFSEDPLRVLRGMQFAARFGMTLAPETAELCRSIADQFHTLPKERVWEEWHKWASRSQHAEAIFPFLEATEWLQHFPEIAALKGVQQDPEWHPEGWSLSFLPSCPFRACMAESQSTQGGGGVFLGSSFADSAGRESFMGALNTIVGNGTLNTDLTTAGYAGVFNELLATSSAPAVLTETQSLVWTFGGVTGATDKQVRVVTKIPLRGMAAVMNRAINELEVVERIVSFISVYVMDMLVTGKSSSQMHFHQNSMETKTSFAPSAGNIPVSSGMVMKSGTSPVDFNVVFAFDLQIGDVDIRDTFYTEGATPTIEVVVGDVLTHTKCVVAAANEIALRENLQGEEREALLFTALCHDFAKPATTVLREKHGKMRWTAYGHEEAGGPVAQAFMERIGAPKSLTEKVVALTVNHMKHIQFKDGTGGQSKNIRKLATNLGKSTIRELVRVMEADTSGRPPLPKEVPETALKMMKLAEQHGCLDGALVPCIKGQDLLDLGLERGPQVGEWVKKAFDAQLNNVFSTREEALVWLKRHVLGGQKHPRRETTEVA